MEGSEGSPPSEEEAARKCSLSVAGENLRRRASRFQTCRLMRSLLISSLMASVFFTGLFLMFLAR